ncbi:MAG: large subunit ribosomal protein [Candidatus Woesearchaeota archaeon]|nr:large subunit ribosomal protein [Candidatus Woesearchaeota archaeon]MDN5327454.1 large subunit ribosomal protein [Candidatus Woesearchaeota archaeon]
MIPKEQIIKSIEELKKVSPKRNFVQSVDTIINLKSLDIKKPDQKVDFFVQLPHKVKDVKVCGLVATELLEEARKHLDFVIHVDDFPKYAKDPKAIKKLARDYDYFVAQANIMPKVAATFGRILGSRGKMPNPKAGCIVPPKADLSNMKERLSKTVRLLTKNAPVIHTMIGKEDMSVEELSDNLYSLIDHLLHHLPSGENNIRSIFIKTTMGKPIQVR